MPPLIPAAIVAMALSSAEYCNAVADEAVGFLRAHQCPGHVAVNSINACAFLLASCHQPALDSLRPRLCKPWREHDTMRFARPLLDCDLGDGKLLAAPQCWQVNDIELYYWQSGETPPLLSLETGNVPLVVH